MGMFARAGGRVFGFWRAGGERLGLGLSRQVLGLVVGVSAGLLLSALTVCKSRIFSLSLLATVRGARHFFVQSDKETKQRKRFQTTLP